MFIPAGVARLSGGKVKARAKSEVGSLILRFLAQLGCSEVIDETVLDYACGVLRSMIDEDGGEDEENLAHLDALLVGACGQPYEAHAEAQRQEQWAKLVKEARRTPTAASGPEPQDPGTLLQVQRRAFAPPQSNSQGRADSGEDVNFVGEQPSLKQTSSVVEELKALCSEVVSEAFLQYALERKFHMDAEALAAWLLDSDRAELQSAEALWEQQRERELQNEESARLLKERNKQQILQKFDLRPVIQPKDSKKVGKALPPSDLWTGKQAQQSTVRYLDGRVVTTKGEKFIIEKTAEDWDGGSRGKVYTKGKRGKGFV
ncbi:hypothetical protein VaNZ11_000701 [Volvox africanus]|uniref:CUE domain-containing protein n=1 Tax=Volvox africanus TaxID=51714 RepID=A0ABQ5RMW7_9CHLO|nr:hypothetical protein VaNZ11_000701 [Volvox africanus]